MNFDIISFTIGFLFCAGISIIKIWRILKDKEGLQLTDEEKRAIRNHMSATQERWTKDSEEYNFYEGIITKLKEENLWDNTLVILTTDHGEFIGEYGQMSKRLSGPCMSC